MKYSIQNMTDFLTGSYLIARIPENELDQCALYTIQSEHPDFILPFHYKGTDGQVEFVYKIGTLCKLQYFSGELSPKEYADLWQSLLKPLLECADWFMNPCAFLLNVDYLYYDKNKKAIRYVYVPTAYGCSGYDAFFEMAVEISKMVTVSDSILENKVLRAIIKDFNPIEFLQTLKDHATECNEFSKNLPLLEYKPEPDEKSLSEGNLITSCSMLKENITIDNINIDSWNEIKLSNKKDREPESHGFFRRRKRKKTPKKNQRLQLLPPQWSLSETTMSSKQQELPSTQQDDYFMKTPVEIIDITQNTPIITNSPGLRYVGRSQLPSAIQIMISEGEIFTIGRFDATIGKKQSNFEFDKRTKAVSRRHAVIERDKNGYKIIDLSSSAGTFVNNKKLPPNTPHGLETGCRVSFGNSGADYVWEIN